MTTAAIIVAAGRGTRLGGDLPKQWQLLAGRPVVAHACDAFRRAGVGLILLVVHPDDMIRARQLMEDGTEVVSGGSTRAASVRNALDALEGRGMRRVLIHDGARPLVSPRLIARLLAALDRGVAAAPALPVSDALWRGAAGRVIEAVPRAELFRAQTPQAFDYVAIHAAHRTHGSESAADDVEIARAAGLDVEIVEGDETNIKITWPGDIARAERLLGELPMDIRTGTGFDVHRFAPGDAVTLCGVTLPFAQRLEGHSDADVGMHALTDAIYGALAEGDIGRHFPPSDPQWKGADSRIFLEHAAARVAARGFRISSADVTLICEAPKIGPHAEAMRAALAAIMTVDPGRVSVKATTSEQLGFTGRREGIAALATATLVSP
ncbi:bifunctional 2-C-methyl-D-erythritol 4-phosphate cytidylyltransferase/2-C-methyl-D-erythritol 2,4-cyclodiphosphate synthase [Alkalilacustris brevis]|uniref:bifunctional 2-C-methyl-D-erythritol 4-phosphate cytidylyltransferase/2-C-methyl-D-erythritol 2,4-cyclodiphosphate synthase n=1 Tax=Alkalilacustris brevis TaxID=2026338 RepID=UPI000E0D4F2B|nr:bifunctional 2-C-methyl-D-erythritol 4-phosphate cytidylyltransferase/2-C-methyl-D-erythritol 2,4-cyclodiphosphate synthase [Alkalilacustris brevis]